MDDGGSANLERVLGKRVQALRRAAGLTQQQLCNQASISYSTLTKIERGAIQSPSIFTVAAIASAIGVSLDQIIGIERPASDSDRQFHSSASGVKFVYFDVNGCFVRFYERAFTKIAKELGITTDSVETVFWQYNDDVCRGTMSFSDFNARIAEKIGVENFDWESYYLEASEVVEQTMELAKSVYMNYRVGLLTNIMPGLIPALRRSGRLPDLAYDSIIDSSEVGCIKPEPRIYEIARERAGVKPEEILLIDDTRANLTEAQDAGWHVLWFNYADPDSTIERIRQSLKVT